MVLNSKTCMDSLRVSNTGTDLQPHAPKLMDRYGQSQRVEF